MTKGRVIADGAPKEIFQDVEGLKAVGLTVPETTQLLWELRQEGLDVPLDALSDEECAQALKELLAGGTAAAGGLPTHNPAKRSCVGEDEQRNE